jgi:SAM-dependent methyltransferase
MFGPERHENLAATLPLRANDMVVDLGCGKGDTLRALAGRPNGPSHLVGVDLKDRGFVGERVEHVVADLDEPLPFGDASFDAAVCQNVIECLADPQAFLGEAARILVPGGHLLLGHSDFDTLVFSATDLALTRRLVHHFCDTVQPFMAAADGTSGRRLVALGRRSPMELVESFAWVGHHTTFEQHGPARVAATLVAADGRRDPELRDSVEGWLADLEEQARTGDFFYSLNDYAVLLRKPAARLMASSEAKD